MTAGPGRPSRISAVLAGVNHDSTEVSTILLS